MYQELHIQTRKIDDIERSVALRQGRSTLPSGHIGLFSMGENDAARDGVTRVNSNQVPPPSSCGTEGSDDGDHPNAPDSGIGPV